MAEYTCADIMALLEGTVVKDIKELKDDFASLRYELSQMGDRVGTLELTEKKNVKKTDSALKKHQIQSLVNEYNSKEYNIIIYNIPGIGKTEKRLTSYKKVVDTLQNVWQLLIPLTFATVIGSLALTENVYLLFSKYLRCSKRIRSGITFKI